MNVCDFSFECRRGFCTPRRRFLNEYHKFHVSRQSALSTESNIVIPESNLFIKKRGTADAFHTLLKDLLCFRSPFNCQLHLAERSVLKRIADLIHPPSYILPSCIRHELAHIVIFGLFFFPASHEESAFDFVYSDRHAKALFRMIPVSFSRVRVF